MKRRVSFRESFIEDQLPRHQIEKTDNNTKNAILHFD